MENKYCIEVYVKRKKLWMQKYPFTKADSGYYKIKADEKTSRKIIRKCILKGIRYRSFESRWGRSGDYRRKFLRHTNPPYRCRYCHKKVPESEMVIDHIIPVKQTKTNRHHARFLLRLQGIDDVNDLRNLAPACRKCNDAKRDHMGIWLVKAYIGKHNLYWKIRPALIMAFICIMFYILYRVSNYYGFIDILERLTGGL